MTTTKDGGPAFPHAKVNTDPFTQSQDIEKLQGMSLRDYFAAAALQGLLASEVFMGVVDATSKSLGMNAKEEAEIQPRVVSKTAYCIADAMIKARGE